MKRSKLIIVLIISLFAVACQCNANEYVNVEALQYSEHYVVDNEPRIFYLYDRPARISNIVGYWTVIDGHSTFYTLDKGNEAYAAVQKALNERK